MKPVSFILATVLASSAAAVGTYVAQPAQAEAAASANAILAEVDRRAGTFGNQSYVANMEIFKGGELKKTLVFAMKMKDLSKQYINFLEPGDVKGMKILMLDATNILLYSDAFKKIRRVAAHNLNQGFHGSEFQPEDMVMTELGSKFDATVKGKSGNETTLTLIKKEGAPVSVPKLELVIDGKKGGVTIIRYFDDAGNQTREQTREKWVKMEGAPMPTIVRMKNLKTGAETVINLTEIDVKTEIPESLFSRRTLLRG